MQVPFIDFDYELKELKQDYKNLLQMHIKNGDFIGGSNVKRFEKNLSNYLNIKYVISVGNGTDALIISLLSLDLQKKEVIVPAFSFFATSEAIVQAGLKPVFVDIESNTCNIDISKIEDKISEKTGAILPVHLFGNPVNMYKLKKISSKYNLKIVEDVAQSFGSKWGSKYLGTIGDIGCFSFFPTKTLGAYGDGGAIVTNEIRYAEKAELLKNHGAKTKYFNEIFGFNSRLDSIQASILDLKLQKIDSWIKSRIEIGKYYDKNLNKINEIQLLNNNHSTYNYYSMLIKNNKRDELKTFLNSKNIASAIYYPTPLPSLPAHNIKKTFKTAEQVSREIISIPIWPKMNVVQINYVIDSIYEFFKHYK